MEMTHGQGPDVVIEAVGMESHCHEGPVHRLDRHGAYRAAGAAVRGESGHPRVPPGQDRVHARCVRGPDVADHDWCPGAEGPDAQDWPDARAAPSEAAAGADREGRYRPGLRHHQLRHRTGRRPTALQDLSRQAAKTASRSSCVPTDKDAFQALSRLRSRCSGLSAPSRRSGSVQARLDHRSPFRQEASAGPGEGRVRLRFP